MFKTILLYNTFNFDKFCGDVISLILILVICIFTLIFLMILHKNLIFLISYNQSLIPVSGRSPGEGNVNPLQYSCLKNPMDRGAWQAIVHGVQRVGHYWVTKTHTRFNFFTLLFLLWSLLLIFHSINST